MKSFYSILSVYIKPEIDEHLSVGLIMIHGEKVFFHYSKPKLSLIQQLLGKNRYKATLNYLKLVKKSVDENKNSIDHRNDLLSLDTKTKYSRLFSEQYIEYLSRYNNNLVTFSKPQLIELEANNLVFEKLFKKLVDSAGFIREVKKDEKFRSFKKAYYPKVKSFFNVEYEIDNTIFPRLLTPVKLDLMGKNEIEVFAHAIDFEKKVDSIELNIGSLLQIYRVLPDAKQFILGFEPNKTNRVNHGIWENIIKSSDFEYVDFSESDKITQYAKEHNVKPLF